MVALPAPTHDTAVSRDVFLARLSSLGKQDLEAVKELFRCLEDAIGDDRPEIARMIVEILYPRVAYAGTLTDEPIAPEARSRVDHYRNEVGKRIRTQRKKLGMTQEQLADVAGLPQSHICRLERGKHAPTQLTIERIAEALGIDPGSLDPGCDD